MGHDARNRLADVPGPEILVSPDRLVTITATGGPGYGTEEGGVDAWSFQARLRGPSDDPDRGRGGRADAGLDDPDRPLPGPSVNGVRVISCQRLGSPPTVLPLDPSDRRFEFTANYIFVTGA